MRFAPNRGAARPNRVAASAVFHSLNGIPSTCQARCVGGDGPAPMAVRVTSSDHAGRPCTLSHRISFAASRVSPTRLLRLRSMRCAQRAASTQERLRRRLRAIVGIDRAPSAHSCRVTVSQLQPNHAMRREYESRNSTVKRFGIPIETSVRGTFARRCHSRDAGPIEAGSLARSIAVGDIRGSRYDGARRVRLGARGASPSGTRRRSRRRSIDRSDRLWRFRARRSSPRSRRFLR